MFVGHFASGMGFYTTLKENRAVLFMVVLGTQFLDVLWGLFIILGIEGGVSGGDVRNNLFNVPWTHSLLMAIVWALVYGRLTWWVASVRGYDTSRFPKVAAFAVFSHWILDMLVHGKDMLLSPFSSTALPSLHLWEVPIIALIVEFSILMVSWYLYYMKIKDHEGSRKSWLVLIIYLILLATTYLPSISHTSGTQVTPILGGMTMILLPVIAGLPALFYPKTTA